MWIINILIPLIRSLIGVSARWIGSAPTSRQRIYFANHSSHVDTLAIWSALPPNLRKTTRPVAAADYWGKGLIRRYFAIRVLNSVLLSRNRSSSNADPLEPLVRALEQGNSLIIFPEGTRGKESLPGPFKAGLYHLAQRFPDVELIPVYLANLNRSMPKGTIFPVPLLCTVHFGTALSLWKQEAKQDFLDRARQAIVELA